MNITKQETQETETTQPQELLIQTATDILQYRMNNAHGDRRYIETQEEKISHLLIERNLDTKNLPPALSGILLESLFFLQMQELNIPIECSTGEYDMQGIDFFLFDDFIPIDVTSNTNSQKIASKLRRETSTVLFLPKFPRQQVIGQYSGRKHILEAYINRELSKDRYLTTMLSVNTEFKQILIENLTHRNVHHPEFRIKKVKNRDIAKLDHILHRFSRRLEQFQ